MESISIMDGLMLTIVSMLTVFSVLLVLWGLTEMIAKLVNGSQKVESTPAPAKPKPTVNTNNLAPNKKHQQVAELVALALASEDEPNKKLEIQESKRIK
ncbi:OadG family protein [Ruoffia tabacinasalis]|uniref:OadG family protein n=1 Tax=Ruoffia tabacinasalis TaxID=87458 RepID=UPI0030D39A81